MNVPYQLTIKTDGKNNHTLILNLFGENIEYEYVDEKKGSIAVETEAMEFKYQRVQKYDPIYIHRELHAENGGIREFDEKLVDLWENQYATPDFILCSEAGYQNLIAKLLTMTEPYCIFAVEGKRDRNKSKNDLGSYVNKFAPFTDGTPRFIQIVKVPFIVGDLEFWMVSKKQIAEIGRSFAGLG